ncbi:MAG: hypothetical protein SGILL_009586, partial [Bacillariaceae sp.]
MALIPVPTDTNRVFVFVTLGRTEQKQAELLEPVGDKDQVLIQWTLSGFKATVDVSKITYDDPTVRGGRQRRRKTKTSVAAPEPAPANNTQELILSSNNKKKPPTAPAAAAAPPAASAKKKTAKKTTTITTGPPNKRPAPRAAAAATATVTSGDGYSMSGDGYCMADKEERALAKKTFEDLTEFEFTGDNLPRRRSHALIAYQKGDMIRLRAALAHDFERFLWGDDPKATFEEASSDSEDEMDVLMEEPNAAPSRQRAIAGGRNKKMPPKKTARSVTSANNNAKATFEGDPSDSDDSEVSMEKLQQFPSRNDRNKKPSVESAAAAQPKRSLAPAHDDTQSPSPSKKMRVAVNNTTNTPQEASPEGGNDFASSPERAIDLSASPEGAIDLTASPEGAIDLTASPEGAIDLTASPEGRATDFAASPEGGGDIDFAASPEGTKPASNPSSDPAVNLWGTLESNIGEVSMPLELQRTTSDTVYAPKASSTTAETEDLDKKPAAKESTPPKVSMQDDGDQQAKPRNLSPGVSSWEDELIKAPLGNIENQMIPEREVPARETASTPSASLKSQVDKAASTSNVGVGSLPEKEPAMTEDLIEQQKNNSRIGQSTREAFSGSTSESGSESSDDDDKTIPFSMAGLNELDKSINSDIYKNET